MPQNVAWGPRRKQAFLDYITLSLDRTLGDRSAIEKRWRKWLEQYRAPAEQPTKRFPFEGASNRVLPVTAMNADPLIARFLTTLHAPANLWSLQPLNERWVDAAKPLQDFLQWADRRWLNMYEANARAVQEFVLLGTCVYKTGWLFERRRKQAYGPDGSLIDALEFLSQPFVDYVSLVDFIIPAEALAIQADVQGGAAWVAERIWLRLDQFMARAKGQEPFAPDYDPSAVALVKHFEEQRQGSAGGVEDKRYQLDEFQPSHLLRIELFEVHARYDTQGNGSVDDVVAVIHLPSRTLLRATLNPYRHGRRPYDSAVYMKGHGFYGIGVCEQSEVFQDLLTELTNLQVDNVEVVNTPMIAVKQGANVVPGEPIYVGKIWLLDDPSKDIREVRMGEVYPSLERLGSIVQNWGERRTGITDIQFGNPSQIPSRTPATTMLSLLQEGNRRFDLSLKNLRACLDAVGLKILQNMQQFLSEPQVNPEAQTQLAMTVQALGEPEGLYVAEKLALPLEEVENGLGVSVSATSGMVNKEVEKQGFLALLQLQAQLGQQYLALAQVISNPQAQLMMPVLVNVAMQVMRGMTELQRRVLEQYDIRNPEEILVDAATALDAAAGLGPLAAGAPQAAAGPVGGPAQGAAGANPLALLASLSGGAGAPL